VAEDFELFRRLLAEILQHIPNIKLICEVADGFLAVEKARELRPDLILMDVGLLKLNGIAAARLIRDLSPHSKIIFVSQEISPEVVQEALGTGASGYVAKVDAGRELRTAVETALRGERFLSSTIAAPATAIPSAAVPTEPSEIQRQTLEIPGLHEVHFYSDGASFLNTFAHFVGSAIKAGDAAVVAVTKSRRDLLLERFKADGLDIAGASEQGRYISLDPLDLLSTFMVDGMPDPDRFNKVAGALITTAAKTIEAKHNCVAICGECAALLWCQGNPKAAIRLEQLWSEFAGAKRIHLLCSYPLSSFQGGVGSYVYEQVCAEHSAIYSG
jgi:DNA-binding NarL/FixJ family response regulator